MVRRETRVGGRREESRKDSQRRSTGSVFGPTVRSEKDGPRVEGGRHGGTVEILGVTETRSSTEVVKKRPGDVIRGFTDIGRLITGVSIVHG